MICLEGLNHADLNNILDYIYQGEVQLHQQELNRFLKIAERLKLEGLIDGEEEEAESTIDKNFEEKHEFSAAKSENKVVRNNEKPVISVQSPDIHSSEELDQKVAESYSRNSDGRYACHYCAKLFNNNSHIKEHVEIHFEGLSFPCTYCEKILRSRGSLRKHNERWHK